jgi:hypothetical protein
MKESYGSPGKNADVVRMGHTATTKHGTDPNVKRPVGQAAVRDLKVK